MEKYVRLNVSCLHGSRLKKSGKYFSGLFRMRRTEKNRMVNKMCNVIAYVGAGGKTSSILEEMTTQHQKGRKVVVTTTTHMKQPEIVPEGTDQLTECVEEAAELLQEGKTVWYGHPAAGGKFTGPLPEEWELLCGLADMILVEADGSKRLPVKVPAEFEPVIPDQTDKIIVVVGLSGLGKPIKEVCHRLPLVLDLLQKRENDRLTEEDYASILWEGYIKPLQQKFPVCEFEIYLNQVTNPELCEAAERVKEGLHRKEGFGSVEVFRMNYTRALSEISEE